MTDAAGTPGAAPGVPSVVIRAIRPDDARGLQRFHIRLSADTVRNRFFGAHPRLGDEEARRFTELEEGRQAALVATVGERIVGVARYIRLGDDDTAEVAFVVEDAYQRRGIGTELFILLARVAWDDGVRSFVAHTFAENRTMLDVFRHTPAAVSVTGLHRDGTVIDVAMSITPPHTGLAGSGAV